MATSFIGGFMGIGATRIPVPWTRLKYAISLEAYEINLNPEELSRAPTYAESDGGLQSGVRKRAA